MCHTKRHCQMDSGGSCIWIDRYVRLETLFFAGFSLTNMPPSPSVSSAVFLVKNLYAIIARADAKTSRLLLIGILLGHAVFAVTLKLSFYSNDFRDAANDTPA
jgi:hypothetical protein